MTVLDGVNSSIHARANDNIYVTGYGWPTLKLDSRRVYPLEHRHKLRTKFFCKLLSAIDNNKCIPASLALIPVYFIQREIFDTLLSFVPDALILSGLRWNKEFSFFIKRKMPDLPCYCKHNCIELLSEEHWKKYDPSVKVSIVLPTYNGAKYIRKSIDSCLGQTHSNLELIIVDDASTDETPQIINSYSDKRIKYIRHSRNLKLPRALNTGFKQATGEYLTWTSDDNFYDVNAIEIMVKCLLTYPQIGFVYADQYHIDENDHIKQYIAVGPVESLQLDNLIGGCFLYQRKVYEGIGEYNPDSFLAEDYDYWVRISKQFRMQRIRRPLYYYRLHKDSLTAKYGRYGSQLAEEVAERIRKDHKVS
ncbi:MAG: glycosyltransferase [Dehalococcoidales bacterium]|nr:glycosyltransferase [Dehalococcoidales bacterium]